MAPPADNGFTDDNGYSRMWRDEDGRQMGEIDLMPFHDSVIFREGVDRETGYREMFAAGCQCPPDEIVNVRFFEQGGFPAVGATWRFVLEPPKPPTVIVLRDA